LSSAQVEAMMRDGAYYVLSEFAQRDEMHRKVIEAILDGVEKFEGSACREHVAAEGPAQLHRYFPIRKIHLLEAFLMERLQDDLYYWSYRVGADTLGLEEPFYIDHLIVFRIHYPFTVARKEKTFDKPAYPWRDRLRFARAALHDWRIVENMLVHRQKTQEARNAHLAAFAPERYHRGLSEAARSHGPHVDTWYGHSYDGINLWMAIDGVNDDNTVILYPDMFGRPMEFNPENMYIRAGTQISPPHKIQFKPGELLVFNPETLHGTQVNISEVTRVALTTRVNPRRPRFAPKAPFHFDHWYSSDDLKRRRFSRITVFPITENQGEPSIKERSPYRDPTTKRLTVAAPFPTQQDLAVCPAEALRPGEKLALDLDDAKIMLWRDGDVIRAYNRICPHLGIDIADGSHTDTEVFCPGHGIGFSWKDGASHCDAFKLRAIEAYEADGGIRLKVRA
jgi:nitrite reductase/ring-hydroxylating ferredoxin subunit